MKIFVYRNLHKKCYSIRKNGLVIARGKWVEIQALLNNQGNGYEPFTAGFRVNPAGRRKVLAEKKKNVHAFAWGYEATTEHDHPPGYLEACVELMKPELVKVTYNPYKAGYFYVEETGDPVGGAEKIYLTPGGVWVKKPMA